MQISALEASAAAPVHHGVAEVSKGSACTSSQVESPGSIISEHPYVEIIDIVLLQWPQ